MNYLEIIDNFGKLRANEIKCSYNRRFLLIELLNKLKSDGFTDEDLDSEVADKISKLFLQDIPDNLLILYLDHVLFDLDSLMLVVFKGSKPKAVEPPSQPEPTPEPEVDDDGLIMLDPNECKSKEYDIKVFEELGLELPDE